MNKFTGKCIGGPRDGEIICCKYPEFQTFELDKDQCNSIMEINRIEYVLHETVHKENVNIKVRTFVYKFVALFNSASNGLFIPLDKWNEFHEKVENQDANSIATLTLMYMIEKYPNSNSKC